MILLFFSLLGILLSGILIIHNYRTNLSTVYLGSFFFLVSLYEFIQFAILYSKSEILVSLAFMNIGAPAYLIGPLLYLYVRSVLRDNPSLKKSDLFHIIPMVLFLLGSTPYILTPLSFKIEIAEKIINDITTLVPMFRELFLFKDISVTAIYLSRPVLILTYTIWSSILILKFKKDRNEKYILSNQKFMVKWISVIIIFLYTLSLSQIVMIIYSFEFSNMLAFYTINILQILSLIGLSGLLISPFFFPTILYGLPKITNIIIPSTETNPKTNEITPINDIIELSDENSSDSKLTSDYLDHINSTITNAMNNQKFYLEADLNLAILSKKINIPVNHLSFFFREIKKESFNDYRNYLRVQHAKQLILDGKDSEMTLEGIGLSSGFSSRSTFFRAFVKYEGASPSVFSSKERVK
ncbi:MAG: AraC family transcriptional regulator [Candidatus Delongbacteria bacterium]|nr:AraC family transcriptional regulator [Candidatus Delongbacteria bacterium]MBN2833636.1 AraC family transcriptional regulator [Candidatus Delongbacteria bacterium]